METRTPALDDARLKKVDYQVVHHGRVSTLKEAAALRGVKPAAVIKTLVIRRGDDDYLLVLVPGNRSISWPKLRKLLGVRRLSMATADEARDATGYVRGTITPFGSSHKWPVVADQRIAGTSVSIGGGAPGVSITIGADDVVRLLHADLADVTVPLRAGD